MHFCTLGRYSVWGHTLCSLETGSGQPSPSGLIWKCPSPQCHSLVVAGEGSGQRAASPKPPGFSRWVCSLMCEVGSWKDIDTVSGSTSMQRAGKGVPRIKIAAALLPPSLNDFSADWSSVLLRVAAARRGPLFNWKETEASRLPGGVFQACRANLLHM